VRETLALAPLIALIFVIGFFPEVFLSRMRDGVSVVLERYKEGRNAYTEMDPNSTKATLRPLSGGPLEQGYPESPTERQARVNTAAARDSAVAAAEAK
jgi:hypothetical protein